MSFVGKQYNKWLRSSSRARVTDRWRQKVDELKVDSEGR